MDKVLLCLGNFVSISLWEETYLVLIILFLYKQFEALKIDKLTKLKILIPISIPAVLSNLLRYNGADENMTLVIFSCSLFISVVATYNIRGWKAILKTFTFTLIAVLSWMLIELSYIPMLLYLTRNTVTSANNDLLVNFLLSLPERMIEVLIVVALWMKRFKVFKVNIFKYLFENSMFTLTTIGLLLLDIILVGAAGKYIGFDKVLINVPRAPQILFIITSLIFPIFNMVTLFSIVYNIKYREIVASMTKRDELNTLVGIIDSSISEGNYEEVSTALEDLKNII